jgi:hypothetical protein
MFRFNRLFRASAIALLSLLLIEGVTTLTSAEAAEAATLADSAWGPAPRP